MASAGKRLKPDDLQVLLLNDWARFRPRALLVESRGANLPTVTMDLSCDFEQSVDYRIIAKTFNTLILVNGGVT